MKQQTFGDHFLWTDELDPSNGRVVHELTFLGCVLAAIATFAVFLALVTLYFVAFPAFH